MAKWQNDKPTHLYNIVPLTIHVTIHKWYLFECFEEWCDKAISGRERWQWNGKEFCNVGQWWGFKR